MQMRSVQVWSEDSEEDAQFLEDQGERTNCSKRSVAKYLFLSAVGIVCLAISFHTTLGHVWMTPISDDGVPADEAKSENRKPQVFKSVLPSHLTVLELLHSEGMKQAMGGIAVRFAHVAVQAHESLESSSRRLGKSPVSLQQSGRPVRISSSEKLRFEREAVKGYQETLQNFFSAHPESHGALSEIKITGEQGAKALSMLSSLTDERVLNVGMAAGKAIYADNAIGRALPSVISRVHQLLQNELPEIRRLREEILPVEARTLPDDVRQKHLHILAQRGGFTAAGSIEGWHASFQLSRKLQALPLAATNRSVPARVLQSGSSTTGVPMLSTSVLALAASGPVAPASPAAPEGPAAPGIPASMPIAPAQSVAGAQAPGTRAQSVGGFTPTNWFSIGAPVLSNILGLTFLSLMALLRGNTGTNVNRVANYALWGVSGLQTIGECLANAGFPRGVVYFASCIVDVLFFGIEVIWVFFDGNPGDGPVVGVQCTDYAHWPQVAGTVCGDCLALVPASSVGQSCSTYCASFGHECVFAAEEAGDTCVVKGRYGCTEQIPETSDILCQCKGPRSDRVGKCNTYSNWNGIDGTVCGDCTAEVRPNATGQSCSDYCASFGHLCTNQTTNANGDCIDRSPAQNCSDPITPNTLCRCVHRSVSNVAPPRCASYSQWARIDQDVCGNCEAIVPVNVRGQGKRFDSCKEFCDEFKHECVAGFKASTCNENSSVVPCDEDILGVRSARCICQIPGTPRT